MSTRAAMRPRPVDQVRQLTIVRDASQIDTEDPQAVAEAASQGGHGGGHGHGHGGGGAKKIKAIPIPDIREVETHYRDYLPLFSHPLTYLHGKGVGGAREPDPVEYDLDNEDEDWLAGYNLGRSKLNDLLFEKMLHRLELACAAATENALSAAGAGATERMSAGAVAAIDHLPKQDAIRMLALECGGREKLLNDVYNYWAAKRKRWGKPILRRLQAPTPASDTNPYNTFRTREKVNRPQTRRRRDNTDELLDKLRSLRENLGAARQIIDDVVRRERRKRDMTCTEIELMRIQFRNHHEAAKSHDAISTEGLALLRERIRTNGHMDAIRNGTRILPNKMQLPPNQEYSKRRRIEPVLKFLRPLIANTPPHAPGPEPETLWAHAANLLFIPLESKQRQRDTQDDIRRGRPIAPRADGAAAAASKAEPGGDGAAAAPGDAAAAGASPSGAAAQQQQGAGGGIKLGSPTGQQGPGAAGLPPPGPGGAAAAHSKHATTIANQLRDRQHLFRLPDAVAGNMYNWRCAIGRGGRARLECIDHVTMQSFSALKAEMQAVHQHYQTEAWPPMPEAPLIRELVEKYRPSMRQQQLGMPRAGSLASQASGQLPAQGSTGGGAAAAAAAQRQRYMQQQAAAAAGGGIATSASMQQPMQQHVPPQAQPAHPAGMHVQQPPGDVTMTAA